MSRCGAVIYVAASESPLAVARVLARCPSRPSLLEGGRRCLLNIISCCSSQIRATEDSSKPPGALGLGHAEDLGCYFREQWIRKTLTQLGTVQILRQRVVLRSAIFYRPWTTSPGILRMFWIFGFVDFSKKYDLGNVPLGFGAWEDLQCCLLHPEFRKSGCPSENQEIRNARNPEIQISFWKSGIPEFWISGIA